MGCRNSEKIIGEMKMMNELVIERIKSIRRLGGLKTSWCRLCENRDKEIRGRS